MRRRRRKEAIMGDERHIETACPVERVSPAGEHCFFGYYEGEILIGVEPYNGSTTESVTIDAGGTQFYFMSIELYLHDPGGTAASSVTVRGIGPESFSQVVAAQGYTTVTAPGAGGKNLVTSIELEATDFSGYPPTDGFDDVTVDFDVTDTTIPDVTINQAGGQADPTNGSPVTFGVVFSEPIDDGTFTDADVSVGGTATTGAVTVTELAPNDDTTFQVQIVMTGNGTVIPTIPAGGVEDLSGNTNNASTSTDNSVTYDGTKPNVTIDQASGQADPTKYSP